MKNEKLGQEAAFPEFEKDSENNTLFVNGMSKRFYAACAAMSGIVADTNVKLDRKGIVEAIELSYSLADELLKQENE